MARVAALFAVPAIILGLSEPANAFGGNSLQQYASQNCMDAGALGNGQPNLHMQGCNGGSYQVWGVETYGNGAWQFWSGAYSNYCLDSPKAGSLRLFPCNNGSYQQWIPKGIAAGAHGTSYQQFQNVATGQCLDGNGSSLYVRDCNPGLYQLWGRY
ncbi:RICIN domain-containing protein [Streptomyces violascens]|uniref:RICIN domain-containing protein n=1 Tax=Streptomyces violascens TaxID=67381 RepID=UPI003655618B